MLLSNAMADALKITEFGNPILRKVAQNVPKEEIVSDEVQRLISDMRELVTSGTYGVGLAAPQVGRSLALSVITIRPTPSHPGREKFNTVIINPKYIGKGEKVPMWEGCMSFGSNESPVFAQALRYESIEAAWLDEKGRQHSELLQGFKAHVFQHETDHLEGILFVDRVEDSTSWTNEAEYKKLRNNSKN